MSQNEWPQTRCHYFPVVLSQYGIIDLLHFLQSEKLKRIDHLILDCFIEGAHSLCLNFFMVRNPFPQSYMLQFSFVTLFSMKSVDLIFFSVSYSKCSLVLFHMTVILLLNTLSNFQKRDNGFTLPCHFYSALIVFICRTFI